MLVHCLLWSVFEKKKKHIFAVKFGDNANIFLMLYSEQGDDFYNQDLMLRWDNGLKKQEKFKLTVLIRRRQYWLQR